MMECTCGANRGKCVDCMEEELGRLADGERAAFVKITELIGELSWGVDLPSPMRFVITGEEDVAAVHPDNYKIVFDTIHDKLKAAPEYKPYEKLKADRDHWKNNHADMAKRNAELRDRPDLGDRCRSVDALRAKVEHLQEGMYHIQMLTDNTQAVGDDEIERVHFCATEALKQGDQ